MISLFSGALGLDMAIESTSNIKLGVAVEVNRWAVETIRANRPELPIIPRRIEDIPTSEILERADLDVGDALVVSAGPSCQTFSTAGHRRSLGDDRGWLFRHFLRVVSEARPRFFVMENVRGVLSAAVQHRPLAERGPGHPALEHDEQHGSAFRLILHELRELGYYVVFGMVDAADLGAAQHRQRLIFLGSRDGENIRIPALTHGPGRASRHPTLRDALTGIDDPHPVTKPLPPEWIKFLERVPAGGNWRDLPEPLQRDAMGAAYASWGGRAGFFRRLAWDHPAPALTTNPAAKATMLVHPDEIRTLSLREYAALQGFPDEWRFSGGPAQVYRQIGNAVPRAIGSAIGEVLSELICRPPVTDRSRLGVIACGDRGLIDRFNARPRTVLNPQRMRTDSSLRAARAWMHTLGGSTREPIDVEVLDEAA